MEENPAKPARRQNGFAGHERHDLAGGRVERVATKAGQRLVTVGRLGAVVREGQQVDRQAAAVARDARCAVDPRGDRRKDGVTGGVLGVDDATLAVTAFAGEIQRACRIAIKADVQFIEQQFFHCARAFADQLLDGGRVGRAIAGREDVPGQFDGIGRGVVNDAALGPVAVGLQGRTSGQQVNPESGRGCMERIGGPGEPGADHQAVGVDGFHR